MKLMVTTLRSPELFVPCPVSGFLDAVPVDPGGRDLLCCRVCQGLALGEIRNVGSDAEHIEFKAVLLEPSGCR